MCIPFNMFKDPEKFSGSLDALLYTSSEKFLFKHFIYCHLCLGGGGGGDEWRQEEKRIIFFV